ncbi:MAG: cation diffusion facilitator family transporter [Gammaproteobacteria bacterium]
MTPPHDHDHAQPPAHGHAHRHGAGAAPDRQRAFAWGIALNGGFVALELVFGFAAQSTALVADAVHNLSDVAALALAWFATWLARRAANPRFTYGLRSSTILAALANAVLLLLACGGLALEAVQRLLAPAPVAGGTVIAVALAGVVVNGGTALLFHHGHQHDLNEHGAFLHMLSDALVSLGVALAGFAMLRTGWAWLDPAMSLLVVAVVLGATWRLLRDSALLSLQAVPAHLASAPIEGFLAAQPGVTGVHDLHVWALSTSEVALTAHLVMPDGHPGDDWLDALAHALADQHGIQHATLQVESGQRGHACCLATPREGG